MYSVQIQPIYIFFKTNIVLNWKYKKINKKWKYLHYVYCVGMMCLWGKIISKSDIYKKVMWINIAKLIKVQDRNGKSYNLHCIEAKKPLLC